MKINQELGKIPAAWELFNECTSAVSGGVETQERVTR